MSKEESGWFSSSGAKDGDDAKEERKPRRPRRASDEAEDVAESKHSGGSSKDRADLPRSTRTAFGAENTYDDEDEPRAKSKPRRTLADEEDNSGRAEEETEILIIPDLDEQLEEDVTLQVAEAPRNRSRKPPPLRELDAELVGVAPSAGGLLETTSKAGGAASSSGKLSDKKKKEAKAAAGARIDLSALSCRLVPPSLVDEDDAAWNFDTLLQSVTQEFIADAELDAELKAEANAVDVEGDERRASEQRRLKLAERRREASRPEKPGPERLPRSARPRKPKQTEAAPDTQAAAKADAAAADRQPASAQPAAQPSVDAKQHHNSFDDDIDDDDDDDENVRKALHK